MSGNAAAPRRNPLTEDAASTNNNNSGSRKRSRAAMGVVLVVLSLTNAYFMSATNADDANTIMDSPAAWKQKALARIQRQRQRQPQPEDPEQVAAAAEEAIMPTAKAEPEEAEPEEKAQQKRKRRKQGKKARDSEPERVAAADETMVKGEQEKEEPDDKGHKKRRKRKQGKNTAEPEEKGQTTAVVQIEESTEKKRRRRKKGKNSSTDEIIIPKIERSGESEGKQEETEPTEKGQEKKRRRRKQGKNTNTTEPDSSNAVVNGQLEVFLWKTSVDSSYIFKCRKHHLGNPKWARLVAPMVDKIDAKEIVQNLRSHYLSVVPTLATLDANNMSRFGLEAMRSLPDPYIIKATHISGGVARVRKGKYLCFKLCIQQATTQHSNGRKTEVALGPDAVRMAQWQMHWDLKRDLGAQSGQLQYSYVKPRILVEEMLGLPSGTNPWEWYLVNGHPLWVLQTCRHKGAKRRLRVTTDFQRIPHGNDYPGSCTENIQRPPEWDLLRKAAADVGQRLWQQQPALGLVRLDLYAHDGKAYFSEFTFTPSRCTLRLTPLVAENLIMQVMNQQLTPAQATPELVARTINGRSWVLVSPANPKATDEYYVATGYPSPLDLCVALAETTKQQTQSFEETPDCRSCIAQARTLAASPTRCLQTDPEGRRIVAVGTQTVEDARGVRCAA